MDPRTSRGFLNNNPGNVDRSADVWQGEIRDPDDPRLTPFQRNELVNGRFVVTISPQFGIRLLAKTLFAYRDRLGIRTIRGIVTTWAPPPKKGLVKGSIGGEANGEDQNDTNAYANAVSKHVGVGPDDEINIRDWKTLYAVVSAIIRHECGGMPYKGVELEEGLLLAGMVKPVGITTSQTAVGLTMASGGTIGGAGVSGVQEAVKQPAFPVPPAGIGHNGPPGSLPVPDLSGGVSAVQDSLRQAGDSLAPLAGTSQTLDQILFALKIGLAVVALAGIIIATVARIRQSRRDAQIATAAQESGL